MSAANPLETSHPTPPPAAEVSSKTYPIAGVLTTVFGLEEIPSSCESITCLWLLHPRGHTKEYMTKPGASVIQAWNQRRESSGSKKGLIAVAFDQRNHGSREVDKLANEAWNAGNPKHAQDLFSIFHGTAVDTSLLIDHLGSYVFSTPGAPAIEQHYVLGISLGGHSAWQVFFHEPRVSAAVVIIGCPDFIRLASDRARLAKLETYTSSNGANFLGSKDFPSALVASVQKWDPKGLLFRLGDITPDPSAEEQSRLRKILDSKIRGKSVLVCSGGDDKLIPGRTCEPFMEFLKKATEGWYHDGNVYVEDNSYEGIGHEYSDGMKVDASRFLCNIMEGENPRKVETTSKF